MYICINIRKSNFRKNVSEETEGIRAENREGLTLNLEEARSSEECRPFQVAF